MRNLAPIGISTYSRINHLKQTIEALKKNTLAKESDLYIFSDAPKSGDEEKIAKVRDYVHAIDGFRNVYIIERQTNSRVANTRGGIKQLLDNCGKLIFLEDDNITSLHFLAFMNDALDIFKDKISVLGIGGFNAPIQFSPNNNYNYYLSRLFNAWGFATWEDRNVIEIFENNNAYKELINNRELKNKIKQIHPSLHKGLKRIYKGKLDAGDYKAVFHLIKNDMNFIKPKYSLVKNIGWDGSGLHCGTSDKFNFELYNKSICIANKQIPDYIPDLDKQFYNFFHQKIMYKGRLLTKIKQILKNEKYFYKLI